MSTGKGIYCCGALAFAAYLIYLGSPGWAIIALIVLL